MKNTIAKNHVSIDDCKGKTIKDVVFSVQDDEVLLLFEDDTFCRLIGQSYSDGEVAISDAGFVLCAGLLQDYPEDVVRKFVPSAIVDIWVKQRLDFEAEEKARSERYEKEMYERLKSKYENL